MRIIESRTGQAGRRRIVAPLLAFALVATAAPSAFADAGDDWIAAFKGGKVKAAVKASATTGIRYGKEGSTADVAGKSVSKTYKKFFRKLKKLFKDAESETGTCTSVGRELGYMAQEWKTKSELTADWIRQIPDEFCNGTDPVPPKVTLLKVLGDDLPHAIVLFQTGEEQLVTGVFHF